MDDKFELALGFILGSVITEVVGKVVNDSLSRKYLDKKVEEYCRENNIPYNPDDYQFNFI